MIGNGLQGTLIGVRGDIEGFSTFDMSMITSAYFIGFLGGSRMAPEFIRRVGHVRVFAALASFVSAALILYPVAAHPWAWILLRMLIGFCLSGVYVTAESWLNNATSNEQRGQALSAYMIVQMSGIVTAQLLLNVADPAGYLLFIIPSVLVSISFAPILLSIAPTPAFDNTKNMSLRELYTVSPLGFVGMMLLGGVFSAQFGMSAVYATQVGMSVGQISVFVSAIFVGAMILQYPIGWVSDRMDRRLLIMVVAASASLASFGGMVTSSFEALVVAAFVMGGMANPLYALLIAYTNDYLQPEDMAAASGGLLFINGLGAIAGPIFVGWAMTTFGPSSFWAVILVLMAAMALYAAYRMTQRASAYADEADDYDAVSYAPIGPGASPVFVEAAQEYYVEVAEEMSDEEPQG